MIVKKGIVYEGNPATFYDRVKDATGAYPLQSDIASITVYVTDLSTGELVTTTELFPEDVISDDLRTDQGWTEDATGWNARVALDGSHFPEGDTSYRVEMKYLPYADEYSFGAPFYGQVWEVYAVEIYSHEQES